MVKINYDFLEIDHIVEFRKDSTVFAAARENGCGHLRIFLIHTSTGNVYTRNGRAESWEELLGTDKSSVIARITSARASVPVYRVNGSTHLAAGGSGAY